MKKLFLLTLAILSLAACQVEELVTGHEANDADIYASVETLNATKTSMDQYNNVLWSEGDQIVAFMKTTLGIRYQIKAQYVGSTTGGFSKVTGSDGGDDLESGQEIDHNVVVYPYSDQVWCMKYDDKTPANAYKLNVNLPEIQSYAKNSFADGAFPMIAVSSSNQLTFRNICGGIKLQLKGEDKIKSIKFEGLAGESLSGNSSVVAYADGSFPVITMESDALKSVILDCGDGVQLYPNSPTTFIIAVPPMEFRSGMKITVTDADGLSRTLTNTSPNTVKRSSLLTFPVITYTQEGVFEIPEGTLTSYEIPAEGGTIEIPVVTNQEYEVVIPDDAAEWISLVQTKALRDDTIVIDIADNTMAEERSAELQVAIEGSILQVFCISQAAHKATPQDGDYVDEYGINHGPGIEIDEVVWAPVNCGYHAMDFKYGKLYQWGRKYGQGYDEGLYSDNLLPEMILGPVGYDEGQSEDNADKFYYSESTYYEDWITPSDQYLWHPGLENNITNPCPSGWRVPTSDELNYLCRNYSDWTMNTNGQYGYWFSGAKTYDEICPQIFLPAAGIRPGWGLAQARGRYGCYWSSIPDGYRRSYYLFIGSDVRISDSSNSNGYSIRCVKGISSSSLVSSVGISLSNKQFYPGDRYQLSAWIEPSIVLDKTIYWYSDNPSVAIVEQDGWITALSPGKATIYATCGGKSGTCEIVVQSIATPSVEYIDEYGINHGKGVGIGSTVWAPVNCGYHKDDYQYGKLYQWGRKYGQGYSGPSLDIYGNELGQTSDALTPIIREGGIFISTGNSEENSNTFYTGSDWLNESDDNLWNSGSESEPLKTQYDPCPSGWRVPTLTEIRELKRHHSSKSINSEGKVGYWFSGPHSYSPDSPQIFLPAAGIRNRDGYAIGRGDDGMYWASKTYSYGAYHLRFYVNIMDITYYDRAHGYSVRCVQQ